MKEVKGRQIRKHFTYCRERGSRSMHSLNGITLGQSLHSFHIFRVDLPCISNVYNSLVRHNGHNIHLKQTFGQE